MLVYNIGISAIQANQLELQTISNNIANAATEGYHRQRVNIATNSPIRFGKFQLGTGVHVTSMQRLRSVLVDNALVLNRSQSAQAAAGLEALQTVESFLTPSTGSLQAKVSEFFNKIEQLASNPSEEILRREVIANATAVGQEITNLNSNLERARNQLATDLSSAVRRVNELTADIAALNKQIRMAQGSGVEPLTTLDQRDLLISELGSLLDLSPGGLAEDHGLLVGAGGWLAIGDAAAKLSVRQGADGSLELILGSSTGPVIPVSGRLAGLLEAHNETVPAIRDVFREWTSAFVSGIDSIQATGLGTQGPGVSLTSTRTLSSSTVPLEDAESLFPISSGDLFVSVTNSLTGERTTTRIAVDVENDTLQDVIARIDALAGVSAGVDASSGRVRIEADENYAVDFAGRPETTIDDALLTGTARPSYSGLFLGSGNAQWTASIVGTGEVGVTDGLKLRVSDSVTGELIGEFNIGSGYQAGQPLEISNGLGIRIGAGTAADGDSFPLQAIIDPDTTGLLAALGIGSFFDTKDLFHVSVRKALVDNPALLSASRNGSISDSSQLLNLLEFRDARLMNNGTETLEQALATITGNAGLSVNLRVAEIEQLQTQYDQLRSQQDSISGVDPNEELLRMMEVQKSFQANAKFLASVSETLDALFQLV